MSNVLIFVDKDFPHLELALERIAMRCGTVGNGNRQLRGYVVGDDTLINYARKFGMYFSPAYLFNWPMLLDIKPIGSIVLGQINEEIKSMLKFQEDVQPKLRSKNVAFELNFLPEIKQLVLRARFINSDGSGPTIFRVPILLQGIEGELLIKLKLLYAYILWIVELLFEETDLEKIEWDGENEDSLKYPSFYRIDLAAK